MYFSMHVVKQVSSPLEREVPGLGTQRSKQCSLSFWEFQISISIFLFLDACSERTSTSWRAFCIAASCWIWRMMVVLGSLLEKALRPPVLKESILSANWGIRKKTPQVVKLLSCQRQWTSKSGEDRAASALKALLGRAWQGRLVPLGRTERPRTTGRWWSSQPHMSAPTAIIRLLFS